MPCLFMKSRSMKELNHLILIDALVHFALPGKLHHCVYDSSYHTLYIRNRIWKSKLVANN